MDKSEAVGGKSPPSNINVDPSAESWWGLMSDLALDDQNHPRNWDRKESPPISPTKWWEMRMDDSPSDEKSQYELEAASFDSHMMAPPSTIATATTSNSGTKASSKKKTNVPKLAEYRMYEDPYKAHTTGKELDFCQGGTAILDMLEKSVCNAGIIDSPTIRRIENNLTLGKLEEQIEKMNHPALWKILGRGYAAEDDDDEDDDDDDISDDESDGSSRPPSPVTSIEGSFEDIISDLENNGSGYRSENNGSSSKYKDLLKTVRNEGVCAGAPRLNLGGFFHQDSAPDNDPARPLTPRNMTKGITTKQRGRSRRPRSFAPSSSENKKKKSKSKSKSKSRKKVSKTSLFNTIDAIENSHNNPEVVKERVEDIREKIKIVVERRETDTPSKKHDEDIPSMVDAATVDCTADEVMSSLTDERNLYPLYQDFGGGKTCIPPIFQKRLNSLKKLKVMRNGSNVSPPHGFGFSALPKMVSESHSIQTEGPMSAYYIYDYESAFHSYVAYFRRCKTAEECLRLYEHPTPETFDTRKTEVVVKIDAATVGATDCAIRRGDWWGDSSPNPLCLPIVPGVAFSGRVNHIDKSLSTKSGLKIGDRVVSLVRVGANSRHLCIDSERLVKVQNGNRKENSLACLPEIYLAAFQTLHMGQRNAARYRKTSLANKTILVLGGATAAGIALIEVARAAGAETIYATGKDKEFGRIGDVGGLPLSKDPRHWLSILQGRVDIIIGLDGPYGKPQLKYEHVQTLNSTGKVVVIGSPDQGTKSSFDLDSYDGRPSSLSRKLHNYNVFDSWDNDMKQAKRDLTHLIKLLKDGLLYPKIAERIPLSKVPKAHSYLDEKQVNGFVLCEPWISGKKMPKTRTPEKQSANTVEIVGRGSGSFPTSNVRLV